MIVEFDLRPEPEPISFDVIETQATCDSDENASACVQINGGVGPYEFSLSMIDPNDSNMLIPVELGNDGCVTSPDLQPGSYEIYAIDSNDCVICISGRI